MMGKIIANTIKSAIRPEFTTLFLDCRLGCINAISLELQMTYTIITTIRAKGSIPSETSSYWIEGYKKYITFQ